MGKDVRFVKASGPSVWFNHSGEEPHDITTGAQPLEAARFLSRRARVDVADPGGRNRADVSVGPRTSLPACDVRSDDHGRQPISGRGTRERRRAPCRCVSAFRKPDLRHTPLPRLLRQSVRRPREGTHAGVALEDTHSLRRPVDRRDSGRLLRGRDLHACRTGARGSAAGAQRQGSGARSLAGRRLQAAPTTDAARLPVVAGSRVRRGHQRRRIQRGRPRPERESAQRSFPRLPAQLVLPDGPDQRSGRAGEALPTHGTQGTEGELGAILCEDPPGFE